MTESNKDTHPHDENNPERTAEDDKILELCYGARSADTITSRKADAIIMELCYGKQFEDILKRSAPKGITITITRRQIGIATLAVIFGTAAVFGYNYYEDYEKLSDSEKKLAILRKELQSIADEFKNADTTSLITNSKHYTELLRKGAHLIDEVIVEIDKIIKNGNCIDSKYLEDPKNEVNKVLKKFHNGELQFIIDSANSYNNIHQGAMNKSEYYRKAKTISINLARNALNYFRRKKSTKPITNKIDWAISLVRGMRTFLSAAQRLEEKLIELKASIKDLTCSDEKEMDPIIKFYLEHNKKNKPNSKPEEDTKIENLMASTKQVALRFINNGCKSVAKDKNNPQVRELQKLLQKAGHLGQHEIIDGDFGKKTLLAYKKQYLQIHGQVFSSNECKKITPRYYE